MADKLPDFSADKQLTKLACKEHIYSANDSLRQLVNHLPDKLEDNPEITDNKHQQNQMIVSVSLVTL